MALNSPSAPTTRSCGTSKPQSRDSKTRFAPARPRPCKPALTSAGKNPPRLSLHGQQHLSRLGYRSLPIRQTPSLHRARAPTSHRLPTSQAPPWPARFRLQHPPAHPRRLPFLHHLPRPSTLPHHHQQHRRIHRRLQRLRRLPHPARALRSAA